MKETTYWWPRYTMSAIYMYSYVYWSMLLNIVLQYFSLLVTFLQVNQSTTLQTHIFALLRAFIYKVRKIFSVFVYKCMCYVLQCCTVLVSGVTVQGKCWLLWYTLLWGKHVCSCVVQSKLPYIGNISWYKIFAFLTACYSAFYLVWPLLQFLNLMNIFTRRMKSRGVTKLKCCKLLAKW